MNHRIDNFTESNFNSGYNKKLGINSGYNRRIDKQLEANEMVEDVNTILVCYSQMINRTKTNQGSVQNSVNLRDLEKELE